MTPAALPAWWSPEATRADVLLAVASTGDRLPCRTAAALTRGRSPAELLAPSAPDPARVRRRLATLGARFVTAEDPGWPFASGTPAPACGWLFMAGPDPPPAGESVAIVGGRRASALRRRLAETLARTLASAGRHVVSGGALGVDAAAHAGCCAGGGRTVCVLGCGLDVSYPAGNAKLFARMRRHGATFLTEHPLGARPLPANFVPRNRLIATLASAVVVVEASLRSGSLSTARYAGSHGHGRVLAVPGAPWDPGAAGCNALIRDGAMLVTSVADVLTELGVEPPGAAGVGEPLRPGGRLSASARAVLAALDEAGALSPAEAAVRTRLAPGAFAAALLELELGGAVRRDSAGLERNR